LVSWECEKRKQEKKNKDLCWKWFVDWAGTRFTAPMRIGTIVYIKEAEQLWISEAMTTKRGAIKLVPRAI
jgi:hypothetical protein